MADFLTNELNAIEVKSVFQEEPYSVTQRVADESADNNNLSTGIMKVLDNIDEILPTNFEDFNFKEDLLRGIYYNGFERPSPLQQHAIKYIMSEKDIFVKSESGEGKTKSYEISLLQVLDSTNPNCQVLVLVPRRELVGAIARSLESLGRFMNLKYLGLEGGVAIRNEVNLIRQGSVQVIIGSPGRVWDMMQRQVLNVEQVSLVVLDEVDDILCRGFLETVTNILSFVPKNVQKAIFSNSFPLELLDFVNSKTHNPVYIMQQWRRLYLEGVKQYFIDISKEEWRNETLVDVIGHCLGCPFLTAIVFCSTISRVDMCAHNLRENGIQNITTSLAEFCSMKDSQSSILITADPLIRTQDLQVVLSINFDLPRDHRLYLSRAGRTGAFGRKSSVINFITPADVDSLRELEQILCVSIELMPESIVDSL